MPDELNLLLEHLSTAVRARASKKSPNSDSFFIPGRWVVIQGLSMDCVQENTNPLCP